MPRPPQHEADLALARAAAGGERVAREELFERLRCVPRFLCTLNRRLGEPLDRDALEDLAQNVLLLVWRKLEEYRGDAALETWTFRFCLFESLNAVRRARSRSRVLASLEADVDLRELPVHAPVDAALIGRELFDLIALLARREAEVMRLRHVDGMELWEIAGTLGISASSVKTHYYRGLQKLRSHLAARGGWRPE